MRRLFNETYFERYYEGRSRVYGSEEIDHLARGVTGFVRWFGGRIADVLDVGAGTGLWRTWLQRNLPHARYESIDVSKYACEQYGHLRRDISSWRVKRKFDLVICQGVLPYLSDAACPRAIANMAAMCRGFLYLESITARDLREICDRGRTDMTVIARSASFYRRVLRPHFEPLGCGLHHVTSGQNVFYELERGRT